MKNLSVLVVLIFAFGIFFSGCQNENNPVENDLSGGNLSKKDITWYVPDNFSTIQEAINSPSVLDGNTIIVGPGNFKGANVTKNVNIKGIGNTVINDGPYYGAFGYKIGFRFTTGSDGSTLSNLSFSTDFGVLSVGYATVKNVTITHCEFINSIAAIHIRNGSGWNIQQNNIIDLRTSLAAGGIGILIWLGDALGGTVQDNVISHNTISGTLHVAPDGGNWYIGCGIALGLENWAGFPGPIVLTKNYVTHNSISLVSDNPSQIDVVALAISDPRYDISLGASIFDNSIAYNDFRGTINQILLMPEELDDHNYISRNLGDNRGHGLHPILLMP